ncbi:MAG: hypothetical protein OXG76_14310 [Acidimicrobiaceae bacterium]|nr:hypothetical protein [Acidimicrobiaceae bacterium]
MSSPYRTNDDHKTTALREGSDSPYILKALILFSALPQHLRQDEVDCLVTIGEDIFERQI